MNIGPVIDFALEYNPSLALRDISTIYMWLNEGCEIDKDILPIMREITEKRAKGRKDKITTFSYFTNSVRAARDKRLIAPIANDKLKVPSPEERDAHRAQNIRWHKDRGLTTARVGTQDYDWLERYEQTHGRQV